MPYKTISVVVTDPATDGQTLAAAIGIAQRNDAHLDIYCLGIDVARYDAMPMGTMSVVITGNGDYARGQADSLLAWAQKAVPSDMVEVTLQSMVLSNLGLDGAVSRMTRYSDLIVAPLPYGQGRSPTLVAVIEAELFGTGAPVLVVPDAARDYSKVFNRVMVAWNEGEESLAAIRKALPVLQAASHVDIVMVDPPSHSAERSDPGGAVTLMLARHGVRAEVSILAQTLPKASEILKRFAREHGADLIVMGAYGHSRFRESILGGVTRDMLEHAPLPLLMAH
jgi:nucleotide-binding universal stress UspA family protein